MREDIQKIFDARGVDYITKNNKEEQSIKENNILHTAVSSSDLEASPLEQIKEVEPSDSESQEEGRSPRNTVTTKAPTPDDLLHQDIVRTAMVQYFNNTGARSSRKLKVRLNLTDGTNWDFVASLTQDRRNFLKYIPGNLDYARQWAEQYKTIRDEYGVKPWLGKFHLVSEAGYTNNLLAVQNEPDCYAALWYDTQNKGYTCSIQMYSFLLLGLPLFKETVTKRQQQSNQIANTIWNNPQQQTIQRPKTFAQRRAE